MAELNLQLPRKAAEVLLPASRYKVLFGGRGSSKSHSVAKYLLASGVSEKSRFLCGREVQKSIRDSVHKLLSDQIELLGLQHQYEIMEAIIRGRNGTEFLFSGLSNQTSDSIKSFEGITKVWIEEAQTVSKKSWDILIPTIRAENSEIIVTYNPSLETDPTHMKFVVNTPPDCRIAHINFNDNPFFPQVLEQERLHCQATESLEDYNNIWLGMCRSAVSGAIYANEVASASAAGRICNLPYDPGLKVHVVMDMGYGDNMAAIFVQRLRSEIRVIDYIQVRQHRTDEIGSLILQKRYNLGHVFLPHDGFHTTRGTGASDSDILKRMGLSIKQTPNISKEDGIRSLRNIFPQIYFDRVKTAELLECLKRYRRAETKSGGDGSPVHDEFSDGADAARYMSLVQSQMTNEDERTFAPIQTWTPLDSGMGY